MPARFGRNAIPPAYGGGVKTVFNLLCALGVLAINVALNWPLFSSGESPYRQSIEIGYAGISRFVTEHPNPWGWNPFAYCGLPTQFLYLPVVPYTVASLIWITHAPHELVYRIFTSALTCLGPAILFFLVVYFTKSRLWAMIAAIVYTLFSPAYGLFDQIHRDRGLTELPWRVQVLVKYGEGPHNAGLALLPLAVIALWAAGTGRRYWQIFVAAVVLALITLTNWVAALALAFVFLAFVLSVIAAPDARDFQLRRIFAAAGLAYLLACFWLTPSFIRTIAFNWPQDAVNYHWANGVLTVGGFLAALVLVRAILFWFGVEFYRSFVTLCAFGFGWVTLRYYAGGVDTVPESHRYAIEFELFLFLALVEWFRVAMLSGDRVKQFCAVASAAIMLMMGFPSAHAFVTRGWELWKPVQQQESAEYQTARWIAEQKPNGRALVSGGTRLRLNSWFDVQQIGGTFESGLRNRKPVEASLDIRNEERTPVEKLSALGVEYVVVHGPGSTEHYRDYRFPHKFDGVLERVYSHGDNYVYRVPFAGLAGQLETKWQGTGDLEISGAIPTDGSIFVRVNYDPGWRATQDGNPIPVEADSFGFIKLAATPSLQSRIALHYAGTFEQKAMAGISGLSWLLALGWLLRERSGNRKTPAQPR
jgi:hypothetical protein